MIVVVIAMARV
jgi:hypothetical protein